MLTLVMLSKGITINQNIGLSQYSALVIIGLISFLSLREVFFVSEKWNSFLSNSLNMVILPLLFVFGGIILFKVATIINS